jgi:hypothetical protein
VSIAYFYFEVHVYFYMFHIAFNHLLLTFSLGSCYRLSSFVSDWKQAQKDKYLQQRQAVMEQRSVLIDAGKPTSGLVKVLRTIYSQYLPDFVNCLGYVEASRLWYRSGLKLSSLKEILDQKVSDGSGGAEIEVNDFLDLIQRMIAEDAKYFSEIPSDELSAIRFHLGEKVELVGGYERFGDAANGPLQPGDRGTVIELQKASSGEMYVLCDYDVFVFVLL